MKNGSVYIRKDFEYTVISSFPNKNNPDQKIYVIEQRKFGEEEVEYLLQEGEFTTGYSYDGEVSKENWIY